MLHCTSLAGLHYQGTLSSQMHPPKKKKNTYTHIHTHTHTYTYMHQHTHIHLWTFGDPSSQKMIVICACAYYLCWNCTTDQVASLIELTTTIILIEEPGLTPHGSQWLALANDYSFFFLFFSTTCTQTYTFGCW